MVWGFVLTVRGDEQVGFCAPVSSDEGARMYLAAVNRDQIIRPSW